MPFLRPIEYFVDRFYPKQEDAWLAYKAGLDLVLDWGRRSGKSELIVEIFIEDVETYGKDCMYIALTQGQAREIIWPKLIDRLVKNRDWKPNEQRLEWVHKPSNAIISLKGADLGKDRLRGAAKRLIALDEFAFYRDPSIVKEILVPQLVDHNGQLIYASTPKGKNHFWKVKQDALRNESRFYTSHATMFDNPFISDDGRAKLIKEYSGEDDPLYRQEVLAEYVNFQGLVVALPPSSYVCTEWDRWYFDYSYHYRGVDHGYSPDPTACVWIAYHPDKKHFLVYNEYRKDKLLIKQHADAIKLMENYTFTETFSDIDPQVIAEFDAVGLPMSKAQKYDKDARLLKLVNALSTGRLKISDKCTMLLGELMTYEWGQDGNDHLVDALLYGFTQLTPPEVFKPEKEPIEYKLKDFNFNDLDNFVMDNGQTFD